MDQLVGATIDKAGIILLKNPNSSIIRYLGRTNREHAVDILFKLMTEHKIEPDKNEFSSITMALGKDQLSKKHKKMINEKLDEFLRSNDKRLTNLGLELRKRIT